MSHPSNQIIPLLRLHAACRGLREDELQTIADVASVINYEPNEPVVVSDQPCQGIWLVIQGRLRIAAPTDRGSSTVGFCGANQQLGTLQVLHGQAPTVNVVADEPTLTVLVPCNEATRLLDELPLLAKNLLQIASATASEIAGLSPRCQIIRSVAFIHAGEETRHVGHQVLCRLFELQESIGLLTDDERIPEHETVMVLDETTEPDMAYRIRDRLANWLDLKRIALDYRISESAHTVRHLSELMHYVEAVYLFVTPDTCHTLIEPLAELIEQTPAWQRKTNLVWVLSDQLQVAPFMPELTRFSNRDFKVHVRSNDDSASELHKTLAGWRGQGGRSYLHYDELEKTSPTADITAIDPTHQKTFSSLKECLSGSPKRNAGIERIVHHMRGVQIGLALGGGAARGMAHLGVFQVLEEAGVVVDQIAGCSVGAMLGCTYAAGYGVDFSLERYTADLQLRGLYKWLKGGGKLYMLVKYRTGGWEGMLRRYFKEWRLEQLPIPLQTMTADLVGGEEVVRSGGDAVHSILESINLPFLAPPINRDGRTLIDGGFLNVIPADTLTRSGANYIISVDVSSKIPESFVGNKRTTPTPKMRTPWFWQVASRLRDVQERNLSRLGSQAADLSIAPEIADVAIDAFSKTPATAKLGQRAAMQVVDQLKKDLHQLDAQLFPLS